MGTERDRKREGDEEYGPNASLATFPSTWTDGPSPSLTPASWLLTIGV